MDELTNPEDVAAAAGVEPELPRARARKAPATKAPATTKAAATKAAATTKAAAKKAPSKKAPAEKAIAAKKAPARKAAAADAPAKKTAATKAPAKRTAAAKAPATKASAAPAALPFPEEEVTATAAPPVDAVEATEDAGSVETATPEATTSARVPVPVLLAGLATLVGLAFAVIGAVLLVHANSSSRHSLAQTRDTVLRTARIDIAAVNTSDYRHAAQTLDGWLKISTGSLHDQFAQSRASAIALIQRAQVVTTGLVIDAAVTDLDTAKGTATVIASVDLRKQPPTGAAATSRNRLRGTLTRVHGHWLLSDLGLVQVQLS